MPDRKPLRAALQSKSASAPPVQAPTSDPAPPQTDTDAATVPALDLAIPASPVPEAPAEDAVVAAMNNPAVEPAAPVTAPAASDRRHQARGRRSAARRLRRKYPRQRHRWNRPPEIVPEGEAAVLPSDSPLSPVAPLPGTNATEIERPVAGFDGKVDGVKVGRLPRIGDDATENAQVADDAWTPPTSRRSSATRAPSTIPRASLPSPSCWSIPAIRTSTVPKLAALPFPVTFALDPTLPNVEELAAPYLAAGQEVVMLATAIPSRRYGGRP